MRRVFFDLETEPFSEAVKDAITGKNVLCMSPKLRIGRAYLQDKDEYCFLRPEDTEQLVSLLRGADEVVSLNGKRFDLVVLS
jgi:hypothetical protein